MNERERDPLLIVADLSKTFAAPAGRDAGPNVLDGVNFRLNAGEAAAVMGPSGCGKSTFLNLIGTLDRPSRGSIRFDGQDLGKLNDRELAAFRNREIGFVFQEHHLLPQCNVLENVLIPTLAPGNKLKPAQAREKAERLLERVGLADRLTHRPAELSGGERQRVAVVRALINGPRLILADEPTGSLDEAAAANLAALLAELNREAGVAQIVVTHAHAIASQIGPIYELRGGKLARVSAEAHAADATGEAEG